MKYISNKEKEFKGIKWDQYCIYLMLFFIPISAYSQNETTEPTGKAMSKIRPAYLNIGFGLNISNFRDFATSPLIYSGKPLYASLAHIDIDDKRESHFIVSYAFGKYRNNFNQHEMISDVNTISLNYLELFQIQKFSNSKFNFKAGGQLNSTVNFRNNEQLFNNSDGVDIISTLFGSVKATLHLSRKVERHIKFLIINYIAKKRVRKLSYTLNIGLVNSSYRNGFAYTNPSAPLNEDKFFAEYQFRIFSGVRLSSTLDYTVYLNNKNAIQLSYLWDAYKTGENHGQFEMAAHVFKCSLLFSLK